LPSRLRISRNFFPNCFRRIDTIEVCRWQRKRNTEYYYGL